MKTYEVYHSKIFSDKLESMPQEFKDWVEKIENQLVSNPFVGKPLGVDWLREKKHVKYRIYYIIYKELISVFMVNLSEKKDQQKIINTIKLFLEMYREELMEIKKK